MVEVVRAGLADLNALYYVFENDGREHRRSLREYPLMNMLMDDNNVFLIARDPHPVGFIYLRLKGGEAKVDLFSVIPSAQTVAGKKLLDEAEKYASNFSIYLPKTDAALVGIFQKSGFKCHDEVANLFGEGQAGVLLVKDRGTAKPKTAAAKRKRRRSPRAKKLMISPVLIENLKKLEGLS